MSDPEVQAKLHQRPEIVNTVPVSTEKALADVGKLKGKVVLVTGQHGLGLGRLRSDICLIIIVLLMQELLLVSGRATRSELLQRESVRAGSPSAPPFSARATASRLGISSWVQWCQAGDQRPEAGRNRRGCEGD